ncbi:hypothetical protein BUE93_09230 [Chromobacterium amazonense]|uniref:Uncharacterized protein n=1 Tax=Chromobacterium amazonense TaxID=1382803 RepID=A0A2S9X5E1_9NEIS|nr:hypothetical protein [Chromobacterium amazonense]PRP70948.1 hypothetical protein BUE93_09230 [Chromobacterium amazonense]
MWIVVLPLVMLLGMTPFMLLNNDVLVQRQQQAAADIAYRMLLVHQAAVRACSNTVCNDGTIDQQVYRGELDPSLTWSEADKALYHLESISGKVKTTMKLEELSNRKNSLLQGSVKSAWARLPNAKFNNGEPFITQD